MPGWRAILRGRITEDALKPRDGEREADADVKTICSD